MKRNALIIFVVTFLVVFLSIVAKTWLTEFSLNNLNGIKNTFSGYGRSLQNLFNQNDIAQENEKLKIELSHYQKNAVQNDILKKENEELKAALSLQKSPDLKVKTYATVCDISTDGDFLITIDKGKNQGVVAGDIALWGGALYGKVYEVFDDLSRIKPITAPDAVTGAHTTDKNAGLILGSLANFGKNQCEFSLFSGDVKISTGDAVVTSGLSSIYPEGLIIGKVQKVSDKIIVKCEVDFFSARTIAIASPVR